MIALLQREFIVNVPIQRAWDHLSRIEEWPSWAKHIRQIELRPPGNLGPESTGQIRLTNGMKPAFRVTEFNPPRNDSGGGLCNWKWVGDFLWLTVLYDHVFEPLDAEHTRLTFLIEAQGFGASVLGPLFARLYRPSLDRAIPRLIHEINSSEGASAAHDSGG